MPRKKAEPIVEPVIEDEAVDVSIDAEAAQIADDVEIIYVDDEPEAVDIPADEQVARFTLDKPPARLAHLPRHFQKPIIQHANALIAQGIDAHEALTRAIG